MFASPAIAWFHHHHHHHHFRVPASTLWSISLNPKSYAAPNACSCAQLSPHMSSTLLMPGKIAKQQLGWHRCNAHLGSHLPAGACQLEAATENLVTPSFQTSPLLPQCQLLQANRICSLPRPTVRQCLPRKPTDGNHRRPPLGTSSNGISPLGHPSHHPLTANCPLLCTVICSWNDIFVVPGISCTRPHPFSCHAKPENPPTWNSKFRRPPPGR